jgi:hypothetical protein
MSIEAMKEQKEKAIEANLRPNSTIKYQQTTSAWGSHQAEPQTWDAWLLDMIDLFIDWHRDEDSSCELGEYVYQCMLDELEEVDL